MNERGSMSVFTVLFSVVVFLLAGLLVDGGAAVNARLRAADVAEQAARAGADRIDVEYLRETGQARLLAGEEVCARAWEVLAAYRETGLTAGTCEASSAEATVTVTVLAEWKALFLGALGFPGSSMEGRATAGAEAR